VSKKRFGFHHLLQVLTDVADGYAELTPRQKKMLAQKGFKKRHMNALLKIRDQAVAPIVTGKPFVPTTKTATAEAHDPNQTTIYDFIQGAAHASA
jgi:hypothetical protein